MVIESLLRVPRLTPGRRRLALSRMGERIAADPQLKDLQPQVEAALAAHDEVSEAYIQWNRARATLSLHARDATQLDQRLDRALTAFHTVLTQTVRAWEPEEAEHKAASRLLQALLPVGPGPVVTLPYVDQHNAVSAILRTLDEDAGLKGDVKALGLKALVDKIRTLNTAYGQVLTHPERLTWDQLRALDREAWLHLVEMVALVCGRLPNNTPEVLARRTEVLQPIEDQAREFATLRSRRQGRTLFDPEDPVLDEDQPEPAELPEPAAPTV